MPAQEHLNAALQLALRHQVAVAFGPLHGVAQRGQSAGNDRDLVDGIGVGQAAGHQGVAAFVVGDALLLVDVHHALLLLQARRDPLHALVELVHGDRGLALARGQQRGLVHQVGQVGADEARGDLAPRRSRLTDLVELHAGHVDLQDLLAAADVGPVDQHVAVEAARAQQRRVERFRAGSWPP